MIGENSLSLNDFVEGFKYQVLVSISEDRWEEREVTTETLEDIEYMKFIENEIKLRRIKRL